MTNLSKWNINIEYGPLEEDFHEITVDAISAKDAKSKAEQWCIDNNIQNPEICDPYQDNYDELLDWTEAEEEEFIGMFERQQNVDGD